MCLPNVVHYLPVGNYVGSKTTGKPLDDRHGTGSNRMITCPGCISCPQQTCITPSFLDQEPWDDSESHGLQSGVDQGCGHLQAHSCGCWPISGPYWLLTEPSVPCHIDLPMASHCVRAGVFL